MGVVHQWKWEEGQRTSVSLVHVDPETASAWLAEKNYEKQRNMRAYHVANLAAEMEAGRFMDGTQIHFADHFGQWHLVNGQHTLAAIAKSGITQRLSVMVTKAKTMEEVAELYFRHDTQLTRRLADAFNATGLAEEWGVSRTQLQILSAASLWLWCVSGDSPQTRLNTLSRITNDTKLEVVRRYRDQAIFALSVIEGATNKTYLSRRTTIGAIMFCHRHDATVPFWRGIVEDDGLRQGSPQKTLLDFLSVSITTGGAAHSSVRDRKVTAEHMLIKAISHGWNAYVQNRPLKFIRCDFEARNVSFTGVGELRAM